MPDSAPLAPGAHSYCIGHRPQDPVYENECLWAECTRNRGEIAPKHDSPLFTIDYQSQTTRMGWFLHSFSIVVSNHYQTQNQTLQ